MSHKLSFTRSPLAFPLTPVHRLAVGVQELLHMPDPYALYVLMSALVANYAAGRPVWLILVGPASCGKSELLNSLLLLPGVIETGSISSLGAILNGSRRRDREEGSTGGLLRQIGDHGALVMKEFGSLLSMPHDRQHEIVGAFREIYDGRYTRSLGVDGARSETWLGKAAFFAGSTEAIWTRYAVLGELGERFLYWQWEDGDGWAEAYQAMTAAPMDPTVLTRRLQDLVFRFAVEVGLDWDAPPEFIGLAKEDSRRILALVQIAARGRAHVQRDNYSKQIVHSSNPERATRMGTVLELMMQSLRHIGVDDADAWRVIRKLAFDGVPGVRRRVLLAMVAGTGDFSEIVRAARVSPATVIRALEDMALYGLVVRDRGAWKLTGWTLERLREARASGPN